MDLVWKDIDELEGWEWNPKEHSIPAISKSLKRFGFTSPILVDDRMNKILAGHGRIKTLQSLKENGSDAPKRIKVEDGRWLVPVITGVHFSGEQEAEGYVIADNKTSEVGGWDNQLLASILTELRNADEELAEATGMRGKDIDKLIESMSPDAIELGDNGGSSKELVQHKCPKCGFQFEE